MDTTEEWVKAQEEHFSAQMFGTASNVPLEPFEELLPAAGSKVLDIGCNDGGVTKRLVDQGFDCYGVDLPRVIEKARGKYPEIAGRLLTCDLEYADLPDGPYALVLALGVLEHLVNWDRLMGKIARVLTPGGRLYLTTCNRAAILLERWHSHHFLESELVTMAQEVGLTAVGTYTRRTSLWGVFAKP